MYRLSMKPQYENWCNCCAVSLFSPWVTPGLSLCFFCRVTLFSFLPLSTLPRSLALCQFTYCLFPPLHCAISPSPFSNALLPLSPAATEAWFTSTTGRTEELLSATSSGHMAPCRGWQWEWRTCSLCYSPSQAWVCVLGINCMWVGRTDFVCEWQWESSPIHVCSQVCFYLY